MDILSSTVFSCVVEATISVDVRDVSCSLLVEEDEVVMKLDKNTLVGQLHTVIRAVCETRVHPTLLGTSFDRKMLQADLSLTSYLGQLVMYSPPVPLHW